MELQLTILSYHRFTAHVESSKRITADEALQPLLIGRSPDSDWYLPDPEKTISAKHLQIKIEQGQFQLLDMSTNGTFLNHAQEPMIKNQWQPITSGDQWTIGDYEIEVQLSKALLQPKSQVEPKSQPQSNHSSQKKQANLALDLQLNSDLTDAFQLPKTSPHLADIPENWQANSQLQSQPQSQPQTQPESQFETHDHSAAAQLAMFLQGLGIEQPQLPAQELSRWWFELGVMSKDALEGLIHSLHQRAQFKQQSRMDQTLFQKQQNNPLKFSVDVEDALHNLLVRQHAGFLAPAQAVKQAFIDLERHEQAMHAGTQGALQGLMTLLSPANINQQPFKKSFHHYFNQGAQQKAWQQYQQLHLQLTEAFERDPNFYFADFAQAYEQSLKQGAETKEGNNQGAQQ